MICSEITTYTARISVCTHRRDWLAVQPWSLASSSFLPWAVSLPLNPNASRLYVIDKQQLPHESDTPMFRPWALPKEIPQYGAQGGCLTQGDPVGFGMDYGKVSQSTCHVKPILFSPKL